LLQNSERLELSTEDDVKRRLYMYWWKYQAGASIISEWYLLGQQAQKEPSNLSICDRSSRLVATSLVQKQVMESAPFMIDIVLDVLPVSQSDPASTRELFRAVMKIFQDSITRYERETGRATEFDEFRSFLHIAIRNNATNSQIQKNSVLNRHLTFRGLLMFRGGVAELEKSVPLLERGIHIYRMVIEMGFLTDCWPDFEYAINIIGNQKLFDVADPLQTWKEFTSAINVIL
jgi:hypothetical protein